MDWLKRRTALVAGVVVVAIIAVSATVMMASGGGDKSDLDKVKDAVKSYDTTGSAEAAGWGLVPGLDHCFQHEGHGMGVHYINTDLLDTSLDPLKPEALVFQHTQDGKLKLGAVEYIVPIEAWKSDAPPTLLGQNLTPNTELGVYKLHAWIFKTNPAGVYADYNPDVSCPAQS